MITNGVKYIGSKKNLLIHIVPFITKLSPKKVIDVFTGTTRVAQGLKSQKLEIITSDLAWASESYSNTFICNKSNFHLGSLVNDLNRIKPEKGWITENYGDVVSESGGIVRVWQRKNTMKADAIREKIETLSLEPWEKHTLITSLILALDKVDNTVGVQQAYLKDWCKRSYNDLFLELPVMVDGPRGSHITGSCLENDYPDADVAYLDPPYSSHSYSTYYHIWDSISRWDKPNVCLNTNRRKDRSGPTMDKSMVSTWNSKKSALLSTKELIERLPVQNIILSYNNEGIISPENLLSIFPDLILSVTEIDYKRHIMSTIGNAELKPDKITENKEYLIHWKK